MTNGDIGNDTGVEAAGLVESEAVRMVRDAQARRNPYVSEVQARGEQVALLVDFENLVLGAIASLPAGRSRYRRRR